LPARRFIARLADTRRPVVPSTARPATVAPPALAGSRRPGARIEAGGCLSSATVSPQARTGRLLRRALRLRLASAG
jgi:hypothetical protein